MATANQLHSALAGHTGKGNGISAKVLAARLGLGDTRQLRKLVTQAIEEDGSRSAARRATATTSRPPPKSWSRPSSFTTTAPSTN